MLWTVTVTGISPRKPCYDGATEVTEKALGAGSCLRTVSHLLSHQHSQTGTETLTTLRETVASSAVGGWACWIRSLVMRDWMLDKSTLC